MPTPKRVYNFASGPAVLPLPVLQKAQEELLALPGVGASVLEISHRSDEFIAIASDAKANLKSLLNIPDGYTTLFLQGGSRLQFSMIPMNLLRGQAEAADYVLTGTWGKSAQAEAVKEGKVRVVWDGKETNYDRLPKASELQINPKAAYVHITSNETIQGVQFPTEPNTNGAPLVCDSSSDFLYRPLDVSKYGILYACAQKNAGPSGVTVVIIRDDLLARSQDSLPGYLNYQNHAKEDSMWNTPPCFSIYLLGLVLKWLQNDIGGLAKMHEINKQKATMLYEVIDASNGFYQGHAKPEDRSLMNVTFRLKTPELEKKFVSEAAARDLTTLKGHRSVGGMRASIYNAMPVEGVTALRDFMKEFAGKNS
jgi:phosphoserine aminotransferase